MILNNNGFCRPKCVNQVRQTKFEPNKEFDQLNGLSGSQEPRRDLDGVFAYKGGTSKGFSGASSRGRSGRSRGENPQGRLAGPFRGRQRSLGAENGRESGPWATAPPVEREWATAPSPAISTAANRLPNPPLLGPAQVSDDLSERPLGDRLLAVHGLEEQDLLLDVGSQ